MTRFTNIHSLRSGRTHIQSGPGLYCGSGKHKTLKKASGILTFISKFHQRAHRTGPNMQSARTKYYSGKVGFEFLESEASGTISRSQYLTPFSVKRRLTTTVIINNVAKISSIASDGDPQKSSSIRTS